MANFGWFGNSEHRVFNYKPIYFDKEAEERRKKFGTVDGSMDKKKEGEHAPGSYIQGSFRNGRYANKRGGATKAQTFIGMIGLLLAAIVLVYIAKLFPFLQ